MSQAVLSATGVELQQNESRDIDNGYARALEVNLQIRCERPRLPLSATDDEVHISFAFRFEANDACQWIVLIATPVIDPHVVERPERGVERTHVGHEEVDVERGATHAMGR